ncbi:MAG: methionyl-tRNA formyltransferase [Actinobacteria bacterium]|nr:methionyl-tRNA formyltransferase [Actinomycetota bacterium]
MKVAVAASPEVAIPSLEYLLNSKHELALIISRPDNQVGRGRELTPTAVSHWAKSNGIELYCPKKASDFDDRLKSFDLVITIGYGLLLPDYILVQPKHGFINLHFSLLPKLRGAAPAQRAIINGLAETGVTVFQLDSGMDTGPIYLQTKHSIKPNTTAGELLDELAQLGPSAIGETLSAIENGIEPVAQDHSLATSAAKLTKSEAQIDWSETAENIVNRILGFAPNPGATARFRGEVLRISKARVSEHSLSLGEISLLSGSVLVGTSTSAVELLEVTPAGKKAMSATAWANGARFTVGETIE